MGCGLGSSTWSQPLEAPTLEPVSSLCGRNVSIPGSASPQIPVSQSPHTQQIQDPTPVCGHQCVSGGGRTSCRRGIKPCTQALVGHKGVGQPVLPSALDTDAACPWP